MSVAKAYAKALYEAACENKTPAEITRLCDEIEKALAQINSLVANSRELRIALEGPIATAREKAAILDEVGRKLGVSELFGRFMTLLATKERLKFLQEITELFRVVRLEHEGGVPGLLVSAEPMSEADVQELAQAFTKKLGKRVSFTVASDPDLLAGVKVTVYGVTYDGTLRAQLEKLRDQIVSTTAATA